MAASEGLDTLGSDLRALRIERRMAPPRASTGSSTSPLAIGLSLSAAVATIGAMALGASALRTRLSVKEVSVATVEAPVTAAPLEVASTSGYVEADRTARVGARIDGRLDRVLVHEGDDVCAGDPIATLEKSSVAHGADAVAGGLAARRMRACR